jgi:hypothetical protein
MSWVFDEYSKYKVRAADSHRPQPPTQPQPTPHQNTHPTDTQPTPNPNPPGLQPRRRHRQARPPPRLPRPRRRDGPRRRHRHSGDAQAHGGRQDRGPDICHPGGWGLGRGCQEEEGEIRGIQRGEREATDANRSQPTDRQGFGNVGSWAATILEEQGGKVRWAAVLCDSRPRLSMHHPHTLTPSHPHTLTPSHPQIKAVSDASGAILNEKGLDIKGLKAHMATGGRG